KLSWCSQGSSISIPQRCIFEKGSQGEQHPGLRPSHIRNFCCEIRKLLRIKIALTIPHILQRPIENRVRQFDIIRPELLEFQQGNNALRNTVNIYWERRIMIILWHTALRKKVIAIKLKAKIDVSVELRRFSITSNVSQRTQVVSCMKIVFPSLRRRIALAVVPGTVGILLAG